MSEDDDDAYYADVESQRKKVEKQLLARLTETSANSSRAAEAEMWARAYAAFHDAVYPPMNPQPIKTYGQAIS